MRTDNAVQAKDKMDCNIRSAFKYSKSPYSAHYPSTAVGGSQMKDIRMRLDFSRYADDRNYYSEKKCSVDENYISKKFVLKKMNYTDIRQEVEKINRVGVE